MAEELKWCLPCDNRFATHQIVGSHKTGSGILAYVHFKDIKTALEYFLKSDPNAKLKVEVHDSRETWAVAPAIESRGKAYLIHDKKIVGVVRITGGQSFATSSHYSEASIDVDDDASKEFFKDFEPYKLLGFLHGMRYDGLTGRFLPYNAEADLAPYNETRIVDVLNFDVGIAHFYFSDIEGYGAKGPSSDSPYYQYLIEDQVDIKCPSWFVKEVMDEKITFDVKTSTWSAKTPDGDVSFKEGDTVVYNPEDKTLGVLGGKALTD